MATRHHTIERTPSKHASHASHAPLGPPGPSGPPGPAGTTGAPGTVSGPRLDERQIREQRILDAAAALLVRWGYRKTTVDDVAREAGVGKGTIYLHWKDKNELFSAAIWRASQQTTEDMLRRIDADPEGGLFHRVWTHGMLAVLANPLLSALMRGRPDIFQGLIDSLRPETLARLGGNAEEHILQLRDAGLIRNDLPDATITYLMGALKIGIIHMPELMGQGYAPSDQELTDGLSDLMRRWLEPDHAPSADASATGKRIMADWMEKANTIPTEQR